MIISSDDEINIMIKTQDSNYDNLINSDNNKNIIMMWIILLEIKFCFILFVSTKRKTEIKWMGTFKSVAKILMILSFDP